TRPPTSWQADEIHALWDAAQALRYELECQRAPGEHRSVVDRLTRSVLRPLARLLDVVDSDAAGASAASTTLRALAVEVTRLRVAHGAPAELIEATAALQALACDAVEPDVAKTRELRAQLRDAQAGLESAIEVAPNGPYFVTNAQALVDWLGRDLR